MGEGVHRASMLIVDLRGAGIERVGNLGESRLCKVSSVCRASTQLLSG